MPLANLNDRDWERKDRRSFCYVEGEFVPAPLQYNLGRLPRRLRKACVESYEQRDAERVDQAATFSEYLLAGFGKAMVELFLGPQNEKALAIKLDQLSADAGRRFFPVPDEQRIRRGIRGEGVPSAEYNSRYWYPKKGGIGRLAAGLARDVRRLRLAERVKNVDLNARSVESIAGRTSTFDILLSSLPLKNLCRMCSDAKIVDLSKALTHSSIINLNIGLRGSVEFPLRGVHWVYVPDRSIPFHRLGVYSNISSGLCPPDRSAMYVEVAAGGGADERSKAARCAPAAVMDALETLGWIDRSRVECILIHQIRCAYVHFGVDRDELVGEIRDRLQTHGIHVIGRYGQWDYTSMEDSIWSGIETAKSVTA